MTHSYAQDNVMHKSHYTCNSTTTTNNTNIEEPQVRNIELLYYIIHIYIYHIYIYY